MTGPAQGSRELSLPPTGRWSEDKHGVPPEHRATWSNCVSGKKKNVV